MAPSSSKALDRFALTGIAFGLLLYVLPFVPESRLKYAFWLTLCSTVLHVFTSHQVPRTPSAEDTEL